MQSITHKRGTTFTRDVTWVNDNGAPRNLASLTLTADILFLVARGQFTYDTVARIPVNVSITNAALGQLTLSVAETDNWPITATIDGRSAGVRAFCDVFASNGVITASETFGIAVIDRVTE